MYTLPYTIYPKKQGSYPAYLISFISCSFQRQKASDACQIIYAALLSLINQILGSSLISKEHYKKSFPQKPTAHRKC